MLQFLPLMFLFCVPCDSVQLLKVYHIVPLQNGLCNEEPCPTLSHMANNISNYLHSNTSLIFLPGNHSLEKGIMITDVTQLSLRSSTSDSTQTRVFCDLIGLLNFNNVERLYMVDLEFVGCTISFSSVHQVMLKRSRFVNAYNGTAVELVNSSVTVVDCAFYSNTFGGNEDNFRAGGAIFSVKSNISMSRTLFHGNSAELGGAIYTVHSNLAIANSSFVENFASCSTNGAVCSGTDVNIGGVLSSYFSTITINKSVFLFNSANSNQEYQTSHGHGGVLAAFHGLVSIHDSIFMHNRAEGDGGAIIVFRSTLMIDQNEFHNNTAMTGGVLDAEKSHVTSLSNEFKFNSATLTGGILHSRRSFIVCTQTNFSENVAQNGGVMYVQDTDVNLTGCKVHDNSASEWFGGVIEIKGRTVTIISSEFSNNTAEVSGGVAEANKATISITNSTFVKNTAKYYHGGVVHAVKASVTMSGSNITDSKAGKDGGVLQADNSIITVSSCTINNSRGSDGGAIALYQDSVNYSVIIRDSKFVNNTATFGGGTLHGILQNTLVQIINCNFTDNRAGKWGGVLHADGFMIDILNSNFSSNTAIEAGGVLFVKQPSFINISKSRFFDNYALMGAVICAWERTYMQLCNVTINDNSAKLAILYLIESTAVLSGRTIFSKNLGSLVTEGSSVNISGNASFVDNLSPILDLPLGVLSEAGAITAFQSDFHFSGSCFFIRNSATEGGAIFAFESNLFVHDKAIVTIASNTAMKNGGGLYVERTSLNCLGESAVKVIMNSANDKGGGIYAIGSRIIVNYLCDSMDRSLVHFSRNNASKGGAIYLDMDSKLYVVKRCLFKSSVVQHFMHISFVNNSAAYGGTIFAADDTNSGTCASSPLHKILSTTTECFLQITQPSLPNNITDSEKHESIYYQNTYFSENHASSQGANLYGGLLDRCTTSIFSPLNKVAVGASFINGTTLFKTLTGLFNLDSVTSDPLRVCFCNKNKPECSYQPPPITVKKGESFTVSLVAVDQAEHSVTATIRSLLMSNVSSIGQCQLVQDTAVGCTELRFNVYSPNDFEELILYADGPCKDAEFSRAKILVKFLPCTCPVGFQVILSDTTTCSCECDSKIKEYIRDCDPHKHTFLRKSNIWITNYSTSYLIYPHCPFDYCYPPSSDTKVSLAIPNASDAQCAFNRSGKLCGKCKPGLSLSLSSSQCLACPRYWPALLVAMPLAGLFAGVALVVLILVLNMTVAVGTLNGIIFYANIMNAYGKLPIQSPYIIRLFIAWLNLDLGFDVCFFDGMDGFWKTLLQFTFPAYLIILVIVVIIFSEHSTRFAQLIGRKNPVATLATIVLLSFAKLLKTIIASLSLAILTYPDGSKEIVWLLDASVIYIRSKHVVLFITALLILITGIVYTAILFSWQWLLQYQNKRFLKWVRYQRLCMFLEPYHAPYTFNHRYWTGLLLLVRAVLFIISAANVSSDPGVDLLAIGIAMTGLLLLKGCLQGRSLYKKAFIDLLEMICYVNILVSSLAIFFSLNGNRSTEIIAYISGSVTFVLLIVVLVYHVVVEFCSKCKCVQVGPNAIHGYVGDQMEPIRKTNLNKTTHTEVDGPIGNPLLLSQMSDGRAIHGAESTDFAEMNDKELMCDSNPGDTTAYQLLQTY